MPNSHIIRLLIADDHDMVRKSIALFMESCDDIEVVGEASDGEQALHLCGELLPDVILLDLNMPGIDGLGVARVVREHYPTTRVVILTYSSLESDILNANEAGVSRYLLKDSTTDEIAEAIRDAAR